jgi:hypothetical protein
MHPVIHHLWHTLTLHVSAPGFHHYWVIIRNAEYITQHILAFNKISSGRQPRLDVSFPTFREQTPSLSSGCAGGLVAPKLMTSSSTLHCVHKARGGTRPSHFDAAVCSRKFNWSQSLRRLQDLHTGILAYILLLLGLPVDGISVAKHVGVNVRRKWRITDWFCWAIYSKYGSS